MGFTDRLKYLYLSLKCSLYDNKKNEQTELKTEELKHRADEIYPNHYTETEFMDKAIDRNIDISIIVPVYNSEKYLKECIESIIGQTYSCNIELIIIDDGSKDSSGDIIDEYSKYPFIKIIHQENKGHSGARNKGIDEAVGRYLMFVDSDDILEPGAIQALYEAEQKNHADIICGGYRTFPEPDMRYSNRHELIEKDDLAAKLQMEGFLCGKLFSRKLWNGVRLPVGLLFEDTLVHMILIPRAEKVEIIPDILFAYRMHEESISHSHSRTNKSIDTYYVTREMLEQRKKAGLVMNTAQYRFLIYQLSYMTFVRIRHYDEEDRRTIFDLCSLLLRENYISNASLNKEQQYAEKALLKCNFKLWESLCHRNQYQQKLRSFR